MDRKNELITWKLELENYLHELNEQIHPLLIKRDEIAERLALIQKLVDLESRHEADRTSIRERSKHDVVEMEVRSKGIGQIGSELIDQVRKVLLEFNKPMHISEIRQALVERDVPIPGKGTDANIIVYLRRTPNVFQPRGRGIYGLTDEARKEIK